jgi:predicted alpha/beta superfamily hydrolase
MNYAAPVLIALVTLAQPPLSAQTKCAPTVSGDLRVESLQSATYGDSRTIRIWLPAGYDASENTERRYPVLYMFDGQTLFDACTAFSGERELQIDETVSRLIQENAIHPMIVVGMDSSGKRPHEYRPYRDNIGDPAAPEPIGRELPGFVVNEVMPHVSARYRVTADPALTGIGGTSLGAMAALHVLLNRPDRFGIGLIESPTLPLGNGQMLRDTAFLARGPDRIYIGVGTTELAIPQGEKFAAHLRIPLPVANAGFAKMAEALAGHFRAAYINRPDVELVVEPDANHTSASWARRFPHAVTLLYGVRSASGTPVAAR